MRIEVICTGDEVLTGKIVNSNFSYMAQKLEDYGFPVKWGVTVGDDRADLLDAFLQAGQRADVVIVNPTRVAVALKYDGLANAAPMVLAMGQRKLAQRIREVAGRSGIPIVENRLVARALLATAKVGKPIPPALYAAVAEILAWVYRRGRGHTALPGADALRTAP